MINSTNRLARHLARRAGLMESLEQRALLGGVSNVVDFDGDEFQVQIIGSGSVNVIMGSNGVAVMAFSGTNSATDIIITRSSVGEFGNGEISIHRLETAVPLPLGGGGASGDIDELRTDEFVNFRPDFSLLTDSAIQINGRARVLRIDGEVFATDINITSTGNANKTQIYIAAASGFLFAKALGPTAEFDYVTITSGGIIDRLEIDAADLISATARRFGVVDMQYQVPLRGPIPIFFGIIFDITATDTNAPFGIKTLEVDGLINDARVFSNSPVQSILFDGVTEDELGGSGGSGGRFVSQPRLRGETSIELVGEVLVEVNGRLGTFKARTGSILGTLEATSFGAIEVFDRLDVSIRGFDGGPVLSTIHTNGIDSLRAGMVENTFIEAGGGLNDGSGFIKSMVVGEIRQSTIFSGWIGTLNVTGSASQSADGDLRESLIQLNNTTRVRALDTMTVADNFDDVDLIVIDNHVGTITINGGFDGSSQVLVGVANVGVAFTGNPFNGNNRSIGLLRLKATPGDFGLFDNGLIAAAVITNIQSTLRTSTNNGGTPFGIVADVISTISYRLPNNTIFTSANTPFNDGDFNIRVI